MLGNEAIREELEILALLGDTWGSCEAFDEDRHHQLLVELWRAAFGDDEPFERRSSRWEQLGFQSLDPVTDLRGCGALGLEHLIGFCRSGTGAAVVRRATSGGSNFPLAAASLNVSLMLATHLNMTTPAPCSAHPPPCTVHTLQNAVRLQLSAWLDTEGQGCGSCDSDGFSQLTCGAARPTSLLALMHRELLRRLADRWAAETAELDPAAAGAHLLMLFPRQLAETRAHMVSALERLHGPWDVRGVLVALRGAGDDAHRARLVATWNGSCRSLWRASRHSCQFPCPSFYRLATAAFASLLAS